MLTHPLGRACNQSKVAMKVRLKKVEDPFKCFSEKNYTYENGKTRIEERDICDSTIGLFRNNSDKKCVKNDCGRNGYEYGCSECTTVEFTMAFMSLFGNVYPGMFFEIMPILTILPSSLAHTCTRQTMTLLFDYAEINSGLKPFLNSAWPLKDMKY
uniref:Phlebovirus glycoprotein G2 fusion domain-containing protein n=1 Tax=Meloidogyne hapla TaxID=6305 RepID=A0A1I8B949_MELHA